MEGPIDLDLLGIGDIPDESVPETISAPTSETTSETISETTSETTPEPTPEPEEQLEGPEDYSPRERMLLKRLEEMTQSHIESSPAVEEPPAPIAIQEHNFLEGMDIDEVISDPVSLNKLLLSVYNRSLQEAGKLAAENIMRSLPQTISRYVNNHVTMTEMVRDFYESNPDLKSVRKTVAAVANDIAASNPELSTMELFNRAADRTREILQLKRSAPASVNKRPAFAKQRGRSITPELTGLQREIDELISR